MERIKQLIKEIEETAIYIAKKNKETFEIISKHNELYYK